jgi:hypothetical protein
LHFCLIAGCVFLHSQVIRCAAGATLLANRVYCGLK